MASLTIEDRYPLLSQRGNLTGKASTWVKSLIAGEWWRSSPTTGDIPDTVERNNQFHINQGPVDMEIRNARPTMTPSSFNAENDSNIGTYLPKRTPGMIYDPEERTLKDKWNELFIWHVHTKPCYLEHSTMPTKY